MAILYTLSILIKIFRIQLEEVLDVETKANPLTLIEYLIILQLLLE